MNDRIKFKSDGRHFGAMVRYSGVIMNRICQKLDQLGIAEQTLVIFTGDNGTGRGIVSRMGDRLVLGGKAMPIDAGCHVPLIAYWKGTIDPGSAKPKFRRVRFAYDGRYKLYLDGNMYELPKHCSLHGRARKSSLVTARDPKGFIVVIRLVADSPVYRFDSVSEM